jgi:hypothetical protein
MPKETHDLGERPELATHAVNGSRRLAVVHGFIQLFLDAAVLYKAQVTLDVAEPRGTVSAEDETVFRRDCVHLKVRGRPSGLELAQQRREVRQCDRQIESQPSQIRRRRGRRPCNGDVEGRGSHNGASEQARDVGDGFREA